MMHGHVPGVDTAPVPVSGHPAPVGDSEGEREYSPGNWKRSLTRNGFIFF